MNKNFRKYLIICVAIFLSQPSYSAINRKTLHVKRTISAPIIDGVLEDEAWVNTTFATEFIQVEPYNGAPASQKTEIKFTYDDEAIYIGAILYDTAPDSIVSELSKRDDMGISDNFGIHIDPFDDASTAYGFFVNPAGVQMDFKVGENSYLQDKSWDAVWESHTQIVENGWVVELRIPYSALRFPKKEIQLWGVNFF